MNEYYILKFGNDKYALNKNDIVEVNKAKKVSFLNYSQNFFVYITIHQSKTIYLHDISSLLEYDSYDTDEEGSFFLLPADNDIRGFLINEKYIDPQIAADIKVSVPDPVKTEIISECIIINETAIPLLNIKNLQNYFFKDFSKINKKDLLENKKDERTKKGSNNFTPVKIGEYSFALHNNKNKKVSLKDTHIVRLPFLNPSISGIILLDNKLITVIDLNYFFHENNKCKNSQIFITNELNHKIGILCDSHKKDITINNNNIKEMPLLLQSKWLNDALIEKNNFTPIVNQYSLLDEIDKETAKDLFSNQYKPSSKFKDYFYKEEIKVIEFLIHGFPYAVPADEVEDNFTILPYQKIPNSTEMVIGASIFNNEILPVIDIAECFGIQSEIKSDWKMIYIKNGNFKALIVTEKIIEEKKIRVQDQRLLPVKQNYQFVYGCYLDQDIVKIILNIEEIAVNIDKTDHKFFKSLIKEIQLKKENETVHIIPKNTEKKDETVFQQSALNEEVLNKKSEDEQLTFQENHKIDKKFPDTPENDLSINQEKESTPNTIIKNIPADEVKNEADTTEIDEITTIIEKNNEEIIEIKESSFKKNTSDTAKEKNKKRLSPVLLFLLLLIIFTPILLLVTKNLTFQNKQEITKNFSKKEIETKKEKTDIEEVITHKNEKDKERQEALNIIFENILFSPDSSDLSDNEKAKLDKIGLTIKNYPDHNITITGHTALAGTEIGREYLSKDRAEIVGYYLISHNFCKKERLSIYGKGAAEPIGDNTTLEGQEKNRRVEIIIVP